MGTTPVFHPKEVDISFLAKSMSGFLGNTPSRSISMPPVNMNKEVIEENFDALKRMPVIEPPSPFSS